MASAKGKIARVKSVKSGAVYRPQVVKMPTPLPRPDLPRYVVTPIKSSK